MNKLSKHHTPDFKRDFKARVANRLIDDAGWKEARALHAVNERYSRLIMHNLDDSVSVRDTTEEILSYERSREYDAYGRRLTDKELAEYDAAFARNWVTR